MRTRHPLPTCSQDARVRGIRGLGGDLHAAVHGAGVHDDACSGISLAAARRPARSRWRTRARLGKNPPRMRSRWTRSIITASALGSSRVEVVGDVARARSPRRRAGGSGGATSVTSAPRVAQQVDVASATTRECRMSPTMATACRRGPVRSGARSGCRRCHGVQQRLRGVLVRAVAGVDDGRRRSSRRRPAACAAPRGAVAHDDGVGAHGVQRQRGVLRGTRPCDRRALDAETLMTSALIHLAAVSKDDAGAGGVLEEEVDDGAAAQGRELLDSRPALRGGHLLGGVEAGDSPRRGSGPRR